MLKQRHFIEVGYFVIDVVGERSDGARRHPRRNQKSSTSADRQPLTGLLDELDELALLITVASEVQAREFNLARLRRQGSSELKSIRSGRYPNSACKAMRDPLNNR